MNWSKVAKKLREKIAQFSGVVAQGLDKTANRFIREAFYGILSSQSVMLTEIGRSLETNVRLKKIEERFCRQLAKEEIWEGVHRGILSEAADRLKDDTLLILDLGDIQKRYARSMEYLADVRDGSEKTIGRGYWTNQVIGANLASDQVIPLYQALYSQNAPDFESENDEILKAIDLVSEYTGTRGIWVIDRGGDREMLYKPMIKAGRRFIIRLRGDRHLLFGRQKKAALELARKCSCMYRDTVVRQIDGKEKVHRIQYGYRKVRLPFAPDSILYMVVIKGFGEKPLMLLTTEPLARSRKSLHRILRAYLKRWSIEETIRFLKQSYDLENIRVLSYTRLKNMMALLLGVFYFMAVKIDQQSKLKILAAHILKASKRVFGIPDFKYYALGAGISNIFGRSPGRIIDKAKSAVHDLQPSLFDPP